MSKIRVEGHLYQDRSVMVCSGESPGDVSWARDADSGEVFVVLEQISADDIQGDEPEQGRRCFGLRLYGGKSALPSVGRILEVA